MNIRKYIPAITLAAAMVAVITMGIYRNYYKSVTEKKPHRHNEPVSTRPSSRDTPKTHPNNPFFNKPKEFLGDEATSRIAEGAIESYLRTPKEQ